MKCLSVQQPWASLICSGLKDVENRSWRVKEVPGRILVHAGKTQHKMEDIPIFYEVIFNNARINGILPDFKEMPLGAIIGYADIIGFEEESDSIWSGGNEHGAEWKWKIGKVGLFKEPIPYKGSLGLFDVPEIDENNMPETIEFPEMRRDGKTLYMPVEKITFDAIIEKLDFSYYINQDNQDLFIDEDYNVLPTERVVFTDTLSGEKMEMEVKDNWLYVSGDEGEEPVIYYDPWNKELYLATINFVFK